MAHTKLPALETNACNLREILEYTRAFSHIICSWSARVRVRDDENVGEALTSSGVMQEHTIFHGNMFIVLILFGLFYVNRANHETRF